LTPWILGKSTLLFIAAMLISYFSIAAPLYFLYWTGRRASAAKLRNASILPGQIGYEISWSIRNILIYSVLTVGLVVAWRAGFFPQFYINPAEMGWPYFFLSLVLVILVQDALFYFSHRLLHTRKLMPYHAVHHRSKLPTPFAMYSFHYVEGLMHFSRLPLLMVLIPLCPLALLITEGLISNTINAYSHLNHEPLWMRKLKGIHERSAGTASVHDLHHSKGRGNYGFYFHFWDKVFKTHLPETSEQIKKVQAQWEAKAKSGHSYS
jgi:sterol desaturase/sphingolipid hydroxylase (fatty acid hydroxylase superfamily)